MCWLSFSVGYRLVLLGYSKCGWGYIYGVSTQGSHLPLSCSPLGLALVLLLPPMLLLLLPKIPNTPPPPPLLGVVVPPLPLRAALLVRFLPRSERVGYSDGVHKS